MSWKQWLTSASKQYLEAKKQLDNKLLDNEKEPYRSKYAARGILESISQELFAWQGPNGSESRNPHVDLVKVVLDIELSLIASDVEEMSVANSLATRALDLFHSSSLKDLRELTLVRVLLLNQLGFLANALSDPEGKQALRHLEESEKLFLTWKQEKCTKLIDLVDAFNEDCLRSAQKDEDLKKAVARLEKSHTLTLYFLAQILQLSGDAAKSAQYCHSTLRRQYSQHEDAIKKNTLSELDPIDWCLNAATLSQFFSATADYRASRHLLCCAQFVYDDIVSKKEDLQEEHVKKCDADLKRIRAKYCLMLMEDCKADKSQPSEAELKSEEFKAYLLNEPKVAALEKDIRCHISNYDEARLVFLDGQKCLNDAQKYYTLENHASDYVECVRDLSSLWRHLAFYEKDTGRRYAMHKRRVDMMDNILKEINPKYYLDQSRQLWYELGEALSLLTELKKCMMEETNDMKFSDEEMIDAIKKINVLNRNAINYFVKFIKSYPEVKPGKGPLELGSGSEWDALPQEQVRAILIASFCVGRLHHKFMFRNPLDQLKVWEEAKKWYLIVVDYVATHPEHRHEITEELPLAQEMLLLIPKRMEQITNSMTLLS